MLRRLLAVLVPLLIALVAALGLPLAAAVDQRETQSSYMDRLADASRFVSLADYALTSGHTVALHDEMVRYDQLYGIPAALVAPDGRVLLASREPFPLSAQGVAAGLAAAFAGYQPAAPQTWWPWQHDPLVVVEPVGRDSGVVAAVVTVSPTEGLRARVLREWGLLALAGLLPLAALVAAAVPMSRWVLRPVRRLDEVTAEVALGQLDVRADLTGPPELRRLAHSFNTMVDVVGRALRRQRAFVSDASHQLRNPLASLRLAVENLAPHIHGEPASQALGVAVEEAEEMGRVLDALLASTRLDSAAAAEPVELDALVAAHEPAWQASAEHADLRMRIEVPSGLRVMEPPGGLGGVLDELVGNALRLSGGTEVVLRATLMPGSGQAMDVELHVIDDGEGLSDEERAAAPGRFWRAHRHQNLAGTGLGLAICSELITSAGGTLRLEPAMPHGLDAVVRLPLGRVS